VRLAWIELTDFRSHVSLRVAPDPGVNVFVGDNGSGKTSLLEAVGYLAALTSFRRSPDASLVRQGAEEAVVRGAFVGATGETLVEVEIPAAGRRRVLLNGKRITGRAAVAATIALVAFLPDDLDLIKRGPAYRREYLDDLAAQLWPAAAVEQADYERVLRQRNALLRREGRHADPTTLDVLDERLCGALLVTCCARRLTTAELVAPSIESLYAELGEVPAQVRFTYAAAGVEELPGDVDAAALAAALAPALAAARRGDMERGATSVGPHRDDIELLLDDRDARTRASQGEQRSLALGLRLAAYRVISDRRATAPVLLLDDVFSELDPGRSARLVERLPGGQVFVTSARSEEVPLVGTRWRVDAGRVEQW
jgi:DNA replication and repair protein RecF